MHITILTFDGFNELDSIAALNILSRVKTPDWRVSIACPTPSVTSMNGLRVHAQASLADVRAADAVIVGSGVLTREIVDNEALMGELALQPSRQLVGAQCSGALVLAKLGLLRGIPACTDLATKAWLRGTGVEVLDRPFFASGNIATAGGCLSSQYLAAWIIARLESPEAAEDALRYVVPVGEEEQYLSRALSHIRPFLTTAEPRMAR